MPELPAEAIRACIKGYLTANGITHEELANRTGYKLAYVHSMLSNSKLSEKSLRKVAEALDYPYDMLISGEPYVGESQIVKLTKRVEILEEIIRQIAPGKL